LERGLKAALLDDARDGHRAATVVSACNDPGGARVRASSDWGARTAKVSCAYHGRHGQQNEMPYYASVADLAANSDPPIVCGPESRRD
jgi:hypothetical protein